jgi:hypothetical protein
VSGWYEPVRALISSQTISSVTRSSIKITEFSDMSLSHVFVFIVPAGAANQDQYNFQQLTKVNLQLNGHVIGSFEDASADSNSLQMFRDFSGITSPKSNFIYCISHSANPRASSCTGVDIGVQKYSANMVLQLSAAVTGNYDVYCIGYRYTEIIMNQNGTIEKVSL